MERFQTIIQLFRGLLNTTFFQVILFSLLALVLYGAMYSNVKPEKLDIELFSLAKQTIRSPITIEDKVSTDKKRKEAVNQVQDVYTVKTEYAQNRVDLVTSIFDSVTEVNEEAKTKEENSNVKTTETEEGSTGNSKPVVKELTPNEKLKMLKGKLTENVTTDIGDDVLLNLVQASTYELSIAKDLTVTAINNVMSNNNRIPADEVENAKKRVEEKLKYTSLSDNIKNAAIKLARYAIVQNEFYDVSATEDLRKQAEESVEPIKILQGQVLVEEGQLVSREVYRQLDLVGLLDNENSYKPFVGLFILIMMMIVAVFYYFYELDETKELKQSFLLVYSIIFILSVTMMKIVSLFNDFEYSDIGYLFPAAMGAMLIKLLINERIAILHTLIIAICGTIIFNDGITGTLHVSSGIYIMFSGLAGILFLTKHNQRNKILKAGLFVASINVLILLSLMFLKNGQYSSLEYSFYFLCALASGITSAVLTIGLLPFFEAGFGIISTMKLIELSNPNHPLLRKILMEAPGTYHHSVMVANLAEAACESIGANGLLARVGCYYHDIGKSKRPQFFIENQMNIENPHDKLTPQTSKNIIIAHATDGGEMLRKYKMPKEIIDIAEQHHGTTLIKFFYHKAKQTDEDVKEADFRYPGPKPQTKETAIIGIADSVEAAVRSLSHPTPEQIENLVKNIIADRLQDGQFNECDLTLKELETIANTLCESLKGIFHSRIEYPEMSKQKVKQA